MLRMQIFKMLHRLLVTEDGGGPQHGVVEILSEAYQAFRDLAHEFVEFAGLAARGIGREAKLG